MPLTVAVCVADIVDQALTESQEGSEVSDGSFHLSSGNPSVLFVQCCVHSSMSELLHAAALLVSHALP